MDVWPIAFGLSYAWEDEDLVAELLPRRAALVERVSLHPLRRRRYSISRVLTEADRAVLEALDYQATFLVADPRDATQYEIPLEPATGNGSRTVFSLPTTGAASRWYAADGTLVARADGAIVTATSQQNDRTVTFAVAPTNGHAVDASFVPLRCCRLAAPPRFDGLGRIAASCAIEIEEVFRSS